MFRNHSEASRSQMEGIFENRVEGKIRYDKAAARREDQSTRELERQDNIITNADSEESILVDEMQNNNGKEGVAVAADDL